MQAGEEHREESGSERERRPGCYGDPEQVCPTDDGGIIQPQFRCLPCVFLKSCLQDALRRQGLIPPSYFKETPVVSKMTHFLKRWSDKKLAHGGTPGGDEGK